jgi:hypothetical protein
MEQFGHYSSRKRAAIKRNESGWCARTKAIATVRALVIAAASLACVAAASVSTCSGQEVDNPARPELGQGSMTYYLAKQEANATTGASLKAQLDTLNKQYNADPFAAQRDQIREHEVYVGKLQALRIEGQKMASPVVLPEFDLLIREAQDTTNILKAELVVRQRAPNAERTAMKALIDRVQKDIDWNTKVAKTLADQIKSAQDDHRYEGLGAEIDTLFKDSTKAATASTSPLDDLISGKGK